MSSRELRIRYVGDARGVLGAVKQIEEINVGLGDKLRLTGQQITSVGKSMTKGLTLPIVGLGIAAVKAFTDADKVIAQTAAVIESTGGIANVTAGDVGTLAESVSMYSGLSDEAVASGENLLLTFTNIRNEVGAGNDVFNQATAVMADMSVALGQDLNSSAIQLGKALNDPIKGVTALQRVGVSFTEAQREQIAAMVETGDVMGAQKLILAELTKEFGGSAKAVGETAAGQWNIAKEQIGNAMESIGQVIVSVGVPVFQKLAGALQGALDWFNQLDPGMQNIIVTVGAVVAAVGPAVVVIGKLVSAFGAVVGAVKAVTAVLAANPYLAIAAATVAIVTLIVANWDSIKEFLGKVWEAIKGALATAWDAIKGVAETVWDAIKAAIVDPIAKIVEIYVRIWATIFDGLKVVWDKIKEAAKVAWGLIRDFIVDPIRKIIEIYVGIWATIFDGLKLAWDGIKAAAKVVWDVIRDVIVDPIRAVKEVILTVFRAVKDTLGDIWRGIKEVAVSVWNGIVGAIKAALNLAIDGINIFIRGVNAAANALDWVSGPFLNWGEILEIPALQRGGIVTRPTLALIGEAGPEAVIPLSSRGGMGVGPGISVTVNVGTLLGSSAGELARILRDELVKLGVRNVTTGVV